MRSMFLLSILSFQEATFNQFKMLLLFMVLSLNTIQIKSLKIHPSLLNNDWNSDEAQLSDRTQFLQIPELLGKNVIMKDPQLVYNKLSKMAKEEDTLQIVADFDLTLTKPTINGKPAIATLEIFKVLEGVSKEVLKGLEDILLDYLKVIQDKSLNSTQKIEMVDQVMIKFGHSLRVLPIPDDSFFERESDKGLFALREGLKEGLSLLKEKSVPMTVISGGLSCIINYLLREQGLLYSNIHIISNSLKYRDGRIESFDGPILTMFNKHLLYLQSDWYKKELSSRHNVILLGDSAADATMIQGVPHHFNVLKIGFFHNNMWEDKLEKFQKNFDIVITQDETMNTINSILMHLLSSSKTNTLDDTLI